MSDIKKPNNTKFINSKTLQVQLNWDRNLESKINSQYGLFSPLQMFIDEEYMKDVSKYMFAKTGAFIKLMRANTVIGSGEIRIKDPRVLMLYHGKVMIGIDSKSAYAKKGEKKVATDKDLVSHAGGKTGPRWHERWEADELTSFMKKVVAFNNRRV